MKRRCCSCGREYPSEKNFCDRDGSRLVLGEDAEGLIGRIVGSRYLLEGLLGSGGYGDVYAAKVVEPLEGAGLVKGAVVGVKLIARRGRSTRDWDKVKELQLRESVVAGRLRHPNLLPLYDSGEDAGSGLLYMAMPVGGRDLKTIIADEGPGSADYDAGRWQGRAEGVAWQVCDALATLHAHEVFHTDVKPQNVMEFSGRLVLIDYGTAKGRGVTSQSSGVIRGTVDYMPPEYFRDLRWDYALVDQYGFGVLLYELFSGELPFKVGAGLPEGAYQQAMIKKHAEEPAPGLRSRRPEAPAWVEAAILRMLEKEPGKRFSDMKAVKTALSAPRPEQDNPEGGLTSVSVFDGETPGTPSSMAGERRPRRRLAEAGFLLAVAAAAGVYYWTRDTGSGSLQPAATAQPVPQPPAEPATPAPAPALKSPPVAPKQAPPDAAARRKPESPAPPAGRGDMALVPAGEFWMGSHDGVGQPDEHPRHRVYLDAYYIDKHEVTVARYGECVRAGGCAEPVSASQDAGCNWGAAGRERHPVNCVDWNQAKAYCEWAGKRLPTEAEWEKAARAGTETAFHYGDSLSSEQANFDGNYPYGGAAKGPYHRETTPVGSFQPNAYGLYDMHGNVWEWVSDWYDGDYYRNSPTANPAGPPSGAGRSLRGGSWYSTRTTAAPPTATGTRRATGSATSGFVALLQ